MKSSLIKNSLLFLLALVFSIALMFAFTELPRLLDQLIQDRIGFPGFDQGMTGHETRLAEMYISALNLRLIGYVSLALIAVFILLGFLTRKTGFAWAGALIVFLPVFGQFALSMFFLAGLGILRSGWLPFLEISEQVLNLGQIAYLPFKILMWFFGLFNWYAREFLEWFFMGIGAFLFTWGVMAWFRTRFSTPGLATGWIYRISRHPQYLGWIIWSYGFVLYSSGINQMKKTWAYSGSFSWLLMTMIIIAICMLEEIHMKNKFGKSYEEYRSRTPFLFPLPKKLVWVLKAPIRLFSKKPHPERKREVAWIISLYTLLFMGLSLFWVDFGIKTDLERISGLSNTDEPEVVIDSLVSKINSTDVRRNIGKYYHALGSLGEVSIDPLIRLLEDDWEVRREFAAAELGNLGSARAVDPLTLALRDDYSRVRSEAVRSLGKIGSARSVDALIACLEQDSINYNSWGLYESLGNMGSEKPWEILVIGLGDPEWYARNAALGALVKINRSRSMPYLYEALKDEHYGVRRKAVYTLMDLGDPASVPYLEKMAGDPDFETRFFARQAIRQITSDQE